MNNIGYIKNCYGCGVCAIACPKKIISIGLNKDGFYEPSITTIDKCIHCGLCLEVCAFSHDKIALNEKGVQGYAAWSKDNQVRISCSSGGIGFEIGRHLIERGYKCCGVKYNIETQRAEHFIANSVEEFIPSIGSKYIQSYTLTGFQSIKRHEKYLITGTPCQIDSFRRYIQKFKIEGNFILLDFFCHSVPSMLAWRKYLHLVEDITGKPTFVAWRNKLYGWHNSYLLSIDGDKNVPKPLFSNELIMNHVGSYHSSFSQKDIFLRLFIGDFCCNPACQLNCKYKYLSSSADIRIGDLWGKTYCKNEKGVSALLAFTPKGNQLIHNLDNCTLTEHSVELVAEGQLKRNVKQAFLAPLVRRMLRSNRNYSGYCWKFIIYSELVLRLPSRLFKRIVNNIK